MKSAKHKRKLVLPKKYRQIISTAVIIATITIIGVHLISASHAESPYAIGQANSGSTTYPATVQTQGGIAGVDFGGSIPANVLGAFSGYQAANVAGVQAIGTLIGHPLTYITTYLDFRNTTNGWTGSTDPSVTEGATGSITSPANVEYYNNSAYRVVWGVPMLPNSYTTGSTTISCLTDAATCWSNGAAGDYNQYFKTVAESLVANNQANAIIRLGWEFNVPGGWPWSITASDGVTQLVSSSEYIQYWQNIVTTMRSVSGANFVFDWNPSTDNKATNLSDYYPGNSYVDAVGMDVYDGAWQNCTSLSDQEANWNALLTQTYGLNWLASLASQNNKPLSFPEWGLGLSTVQTGPGEISCGDDAYFVQQLATFIATHNFIEAGVWNYGVDPLPGTSAVPNPNATAAFINDFK